MQDSFAPPQVNAPVEQQQQSVDAPVVKQQQFASAENLFNPILDVSKKIVPRVHDRILTGITGFDRLIQGGIPQGSSILVTGGCGSGKTIFSLQFLVNGARDYGEAGVYISFEEEADGIRESAREFGWPVEDLEAKKKLAILFQDPYEIKDFSKSFGGQIYYTFKEMNVKRIVIDSITYLNASMHNIQETRKTLSSLIKRLKEIGCTTFIISEIPETELVAGHYGVEEFVVDGVINLHNLLLRDVRQRAVEILKLRHTNHDTFLHPFKITSRGIEVYPDERVFKD